MEVLIMRKNKLTAWMLAAALATFAAALLQLGCDINVKKEANGKDKQVDITTPVGGIHVSQQPDAAAVGIAVYPGARLKEKDSDGSDKTANVNISGFGFGIKVVALEYESDDAPAKVLSFYRDQLKKRYGNVLECHSSSHFNVDMKTDSHDSRSNELTCEGDHGSNIELKVGKKDDQHIVAVSPKAKAQASRWSTCALTARMLTSE